MDLENLVYTLGTFERKGWGCEVEIYFHSSYYAIPRGAITLRDRAIKKVIEIDIEESVEEKSHLTDEDALELTNYIVLLQRGLTQNDEFSKTINFINSLKGE